MRIFWLPLLVTFCMYEGVLSKSPEHVCGKTTTNSRTFKLSVSSRRNHSNEWEETFTALAESGHPSGPMDIDLTHTVFECDSKRSIYIQGVTHAPKPVVHDDRLHFHERCGINAAILEDGRSAQKIKNDDGTYAQLFTNRPLRDNEIFEVKLDKKNGGYSYCRIIIGIITRTPETMEFIVSMYKSPYAWIYEHNHVYSNGEVKFENYGKNVNSMEVGDRVGVMRNKFGTLHFFYNGVDQGPAASNIPSNVYGLVEIEGNAKKVSIVDSSSSR